MAVGLIILNIYHEYVVNLPHSHTPFPCIIEGNNTVQIKKIT